MRRGGCDRAGASGLAGLALGRRVGDQGFVKRSNAVKHGSVATVFPNRFAVNFGDGGLGAESACEKGLVGSVGIHEREISFKNRDVICAAQVDDLLTRDAVHAVVAGRGPNRTFANNEEVAGVGGVHKAVRVKHQGFVGTCLFGLKAGNDAVQFRVAVVLGVLAHGQAAHLWDSGEADAFGLDFLGRFRVFDDDHDWGASAAERRVLEGFYFDAARDHEAAVGIGGHPVGFCGHLQRIVDVCAGHGDVERYGFAAVKETVHMFVKERPCAVVKAHALPHAVAQHETRIVDRNHGFGAVFEGAVHVNLDVAIAGIFFGVVCGLAVRVVLHGGGFRQEFCKRIGVEA